MEEGGRHRSEEPDGDDNNLSMSPLTVPRTIVQGLPRDNICYSRTSADSSDGESDSERGDNCHRADEIIPDYEDFSSEEKLDHCLGTVNDLQKSVEDISASTQVTNTEVKALKSVLDSVLRRLDQLLVEQDRARQRATTTEAVAPLPRNFDHPVPQVTSWSMVAKNSKFINNQKNKENDKTNSTGSNIIHRNTFRDLQVSIPAYRNMTEEEYYGTGKPPAAPKASGPQKRQVNGSLSASQIENIKNGRSSQHFSPMTILHFTGMKRNRIFEVKSLFKSIGITLSWIRNISFVGRSVMELITFEDKKVQVINYLEKYGIIFMPTFDPLSTENLKDSRKYAQIDDEKKKALAEQLYRKRMALTLARLPKNGVHSRMRNFLNTQLNPAELTNVSPQEHITSSPITKNQVADGASQVTIVTPEADSTIVGSHESGDRSSDDEVEIVTPTITRFVGNGQPTAILMNNDIPHKPLENVCTSLVTNKPPSDKRFLSSDCEAATPNKRLASANASSSDDSNTSIDSQTLNEL